MIKQRQYFKYDKAGATSGMITGPNVGVFLLMPDEVEEFKLLVTRGLSFNESFTRLTGKEVTPDMGQVALVVELVEMSI